MIDLHFDLLTKLYISYLDDDFTFIDEFIKNYNENNVSGVIANMCFMSKEEMKEEYHKNYFNEKVSPVEMFALAKKLLEDRIDKNVNVVLSIEGCDYISISDLDILYNLGLRAIAPVWNEKNIYGSGNRTKEGLSKLGVKFIWHAFELGIGVDLSHANLKTFDDIIEVAKCAKSVELNPIVYASHSNVYNLCNRDRNLTDKQLLKIKELNGIVGIMSNKNFIYKDAIKNNIDIEVLKVAYLNHIKYLENLFGDINNIAVSTDDMTFCACKDPDYAKCPIFNYYSINRELSNVLLTNYSNEEVKRILNINAKNLIDKLNNKKKVKRK